MQLSAPKNNVLIHKWDRFSPISNHWSLWTDTLKRFSSKEWFVRELDIAEKKQKGGAAADTRERERERESESEEEREKESEGERVRETEEERERKRASERDSARGRETERDSARERERERERASARAKKRERERERERWTRNVPLIRNRSVAEDAREEGKRGDGWRKTTRNALKSSEGGEKG